jgi:hypothetical protein
MTFAHTGTMFLLSLQANGPSPAVASRRSSLLLMRLMQKTLSGNRTSTSNGVGCSNKPSKVVHAATLPGCSRRLRLEMKRSADTMTS